VIILSIDFMTNLKKKRKIKERMRKFMIQSETSQTLFRKRPLSSR